MHAYVIAFTVFTSGNETEGEEPVKKTSESRVDQMLVSLEWAQKKLLSSSVLYALSVA